ncbi:MAG TPA: FAD-dependent oxidoreductase, partial [Isosphaeraceae bacterium]
MGIDPTRAEAVRSASLPHRWTRVDDPDAVAVVASYSTVIAGAGPAGLTAAYELTKNGHPCVVLESEPALVGGISRTDTYKGYRFDIGGHRFFSKSDEVNRLWREILGDELIVRERLSRIFYSRKFFYYPLRPFDALSKLGIFRATKMVLSYIRARLWPIRPERSYEDWLVNRFGRLLFETFFKTYTEKVWGMSTDTISPDWAAQRVKGLDLYRTIVNAFLPGRRGEDGEVIKTLIDQFQYPRLGPGQMWEAARDKVKAGGSAVHMDAAVESIEHDGSSIAAFVTKDHRRRRTRYLGHHVVSTLPVRTLIRSMVPPAPAEVMEAANALKYRDFLTVVLIVDKAETFPDNWIYIHATDVEVCRIQNYGSWSPYLVKDGRTCLGLEYFVFEGDDM